MTDKKPLLEHQKQRLELAIDEISTPIFSTNYKCLSIIFERHFFYAVFHVRIIQSFHIKQINHINYRIVAYKLLICLEIYGAHLIEQDKF